jgi:DNA-binding HxlR family transcriptional regulator
MRKDRPSESAPPHRSKCPIACSLDLVGDRWTILVIRDLMRGLGRYGELLKQPEGIPTNILANRLVQLEARKIITRKRYQENPPRFEYSLTPAGRSLAPVVGALAKWGLKHVAGTLPDRELFKSLGGEGAPAPGTLGVTSPYVRATRPTTGRPAPGR